MSEIKKSEWFLLICYLASLIIMGIYPSPETLIFPQILIFGIILSVYEDDIISYNFNQIKEKGHQNIIFNIVIGIFIAQALGNIISIYILKIPKLDLTNLLYVAAAPIVSVLFSAINEEVIYRKIIFGKLHDRAGFWVAAIFSSLVFMVSHANTAGWLGYFFIGIVWCYIYRKFNNIGILIFSHMILNLVAFIVMSFK